MNGTDTLVTFDIADGTRLAPSLDISPDASGAYDITMDHRSNQVWIVGVDNDSAVVVDRRDGSEITRIDLSTPDSFLVDTVFDLEDATAYVSDRDAGLINRVSTSTFTSLGTITGFPAGFSPGWMAVHPVNGDIFVTDWQDNQIARVDAATLAVSDMTYTSGFRLRDLTFSADGDTLYVANGVGNDEVLIIDPSDLSIQNQVAVGEDPWALDLTPDESQLFVANQDSRDVSVIALPSLAVQSITLTPSADPRDIEIAPNGAAVYVPTGGISGEDGVFVINPDTLNVAKTYTFGDDDSFSNVIAVAPELPGDALFSDRFESYFQ